MELYIQKMNAAGIRYLLIGGQAMRLEGMPRFSMDWDFFIPCKDPANNDKLNDVFADAFDFHLEPLGPGGAGFVQTFQTMHGVVQFHYMPLGLPPFDEAERRSVVHTTESGTPVECVAPEDLLASKLASHRGKDAEDIEFLQIKYAR